MTKNIAVDSDLTGTPWAIAAKLLTRWLEEGVRVDTLLETLPRSLKGVERGRCQGLLLGALRHLGRIEGHLEKLVTRPPRERLRAILLLAGYELIEGGEDGHVARVVHHAVEQAKTLASLPEARMVNAVVRKLAAALAAETVPGERATVEELAAYYSHPAWMVARWLENFGAEAVRKLLDWNQTPGSLHVRWRGADAPTGEVEQWLAPTKWEKFFEVKQGHWPDIERLLAAGTVYAQDPSTRLAVELLNPSAGETIFDVCAAPGGKSLAIADRMGKGRVVAMDLPGARIERLKENLGRAGEVDVALVQGDVLKDVVDLLGEHALPIAYPAVLVDAPCSNTGVMRHRVDVKWRLQEGDFKKHGGQQLNLLLAAGRLVAPGGRLVYSTCSIDSEENEDVVQAFMAQAKVPYELVDSIVSFPWTTGHDGAAAFLLRRV